LGRYTKQGDVDKNPQRKRYREGKTDDRGG
jgi:hypothetical protein